MRTPILLSVMLALSLLLAACGGAGPTEAATPSTGVSITVETDPSPARMGDVEIRLTLQDAQGLPVTGADVFVFADHTDMSGMTMNGQASEAGNGVYTIRADFSMSGNWVLQVEVKRDGQTEIQEIPIIIQ